MTLPTPNPAGLPPVQEWPILTPPDCPDCEDAAHVIWRGPATGLDYDGAPVNLWQCGGCCAEWAIPAHHWPITDGPDCPTCDRTDAVWAALDPDEGGDLWICQDGHEFTVTPEGLVIPGEDDR